MRLDVGASHVGCNSFGVRSRACRAGRGFKIATPSHTSKYVIPCSPWALTQERLFFVLYESEFEEEFNSAVDLEHVKKAWMLACPASATIHLG